MAQSRKSISKTLRFEVFKRDSFTCQYCGRMAPDVVLEVDHINPVKYGGRNDILNLITSCFDCNRGKGQKQLTNNQVIKQQQEQLKELNEKREQLKMLVEWKKELEKFDNEQVDIIDKIIIECLKRCLSDYGKQQIKKHIKIFGISEVMEATKISIQQYHKGNDDGIKKVIDYIPKICAVRKKQESNPFVFKRMYIRGILKNKMPIYNEQRLKHMLNSIVDDQESFDAVSFIAKTAKNWTIFWNEINELFYGDF
jgi:hypothetical protein